MTPSVDPEFERAMDKLRLQVHPENIMAVGRVFRKQADDLHLCLRDLDRSTQLYPCGGDPVSQDVLRDGSFGGKIRQMVAVHWDHWRELENVVKNLEDVARSYGFNETEIADSMKTKIQ